MISKLYNYIDFKSINSSVKYLSISALFTGIALGFFFTLIVILAKYKTYNTCRLWDSITEKKLDKDRFRKDLGDLIPAYTEVAKRLGILHEQSNISAVNVTKLSSVKRKKK